MAVDTREGERSIVNMQKWMTGQYDTFLTDNCLKCRTSFQTEDEKTIVIIKICMKRKEERGCEAVKKRHGKVRNHNTDRFELLQQFLKRVSCIPAT